MPRVSRTIRLRVRLTEDCVYDPAGAAERQMPRCSGVMMLANLPFLISTNSFGVIALLIFMGSSLLFLMPVFATRGTTQLLWFGVVGFLLTVELAGLVTLGILVNNGTIWT
jgi:hypothetical protein